MRVIGCLQVAEAWSAPDLLLIAFLLTSLIALNPASRPEARPPESAKSADEIQDEKFAAECESLLRKLEADLSDETNLRECERNLRMLERSRDQLGKESRARLLEARRSFELKRLEFLSRSALADEKAAGTDLEAALRSYDAAMREMRNVWREHVPRKGPDGRPVSSDPFIDAYKSLIGRSDALVQKLIDPAYVESVPARDMLSFRERKYWGGSRYGVQGTWIDQALIVTHLPSDDHRKLVGIYSLDGWTVEWWDYVFDLEFTILGGDFELLLRYRPDGYPYYSIAFKDGEDGYEKDQTYRLTVKVIGSKVTVESADQPSTADELRPTVSRTGGIGIRVGPGSKVAIKALKLKVLRPRGGK